MILYLLLVRGSKIEDKFGLETPFYCWLIELALIAVLIIGSANASTEEHCPKPQLINKSTEAWIPHDHKTLVSIDGKCSEKYKDAPCIKKFIKLKPRTYNVICGAKI